jgi:hypothetical protein
MIFRIFSFFLVPMLQRGNAYSVALAAIFKNIAQSHLQTSQIQAVESIILLKKCRWSDPVGIPTLEHGNKKKCLNHDSDNLLIEVIPKS